MEMRSSGPTRLETRTEESGILANGGDVESRSCNESEMPLAAASDLVSVRKGIDGF